MPRRALILITAVVLALHWLVLGEVSLGWDHAPQPAVKVFSTRSIAAPPPVLPAAQTADAAAAVPQRPAPAARPAPRQPPAARPSAPPAPPAPPAQPSTPDNTPADMATATDTGGEPAQPPADTEIAGAQPDVGAAPAPSPQAAASAVSGPVAQAANTPASAPLPASVDTSASAGIDISPPGDGTGRSTSTAPPPARLPPPTRLAFDVSGQAKKFAYSARAELLWQHDGARYEARQEISAFLFGSRAQRSVGSISSQGLLPERFSDKSRSEQAAHFDYAKGRVIFSANTPEAALGPGTQDRLSVFIQLGALLAADPGRFVPGTHVTLTTVSARSADRWTFSVEATETLDLPTGPTEALKLQRLPRKDYDQKAELWVAPALGYLPVRIRITQANGDFADLQLRSHTAP